MRPYWKGYLKLALVSCPIALHAACSTSERIAFRQINKVTGNRLRQQLVDDTQLSRDPHAQDWTIHEDGREIGRLFSPTLASSW
jgi:non-homologous end joining protein Ku